MKNEKSKANLLLVWCGACCACVLGGGGMGYACEPSSANFALESHSVRVILQFDLS